MQADKIIQLIGKFSDKILFFNITGNDKFNIPFLIAWIGFSALYLTFRLRFVNVRYFFSCVRLALSSKIEKKQMNFGNHSKNKSMSTSKKIVLTGIGEAIDVSSIFGVTVAVSLCGPGVIFWILVAGLFSMPVRFMEVALGHSTRRFDKKNQIMIGGPQHYIKIMFSIIKAKKLGSLVAGIFSICIIVSTFISPQVNQTIHVFRSLVPGFDAYEFIASAFFTFLIMLILLRGFRAITVVVSRMVKLMSILYIFTCFLIIYKHRDKLGYISEQIILQAFSFKAIEGSVLFTVITAFKRVFFANDVGQGVSSIGHVNSLNKNSIQEGIMSMSATVIITLIMALCSGIIVVITDAYLQNKDAMGTVIYAFDTINPWLKYSLFCVVPMFAITTAISWGYFGQKAWANLFGLKTVFIYNILLSTAYIICGMTHDFTLILNVTDIFNLSIAIPNIIALLIGVKFIARRLRRDY